METKLLQKLMNLPLTDRGNAERLQILFGNKWKYLSRYRGWMRWDRYCWRGRKTEEMWQAAAEAFRTLALEIYRLPVPPGDMEQDRRVRIMAWLTRSQLNYHTTLAVRYFKEMNREDQAG